MSMKSLSHRVEAIRVQALLNRITELEAMIEEQEQGRMYHVTFDLRQLTREERDRLEAIYNALEARKGECHDQLDGTSQAD